MTLPVAHDRRAGQTLLLGVVTLSVLFGCLGLVVDLGLAYIKRHSAQAAADSAALAAASYAMARGYTCGANNVICGTVYTCASASPPNDELQAGCLYAAQNGFTTGVTMTAGSSGSPVPGNSAAYWNKANITTTGPLGFLSVVGATTATINVQSVGGIAATPPSSCIYVLNTTASKAFSMAGTSSVSSDCGLYVNSSASDAMRMVGNSSISANTILVSGGTSLGANTTASPAPQTNQSQVTNPLSGLSFPAIGPCDHINWSTTSGTTLNPGVYCGGISITGSGTVTFNSGSYYLDGGGLSIAGSGQINGSGVTFFNTGDSTHSVNAITVNGSGNLNLSAPTTGTYRGVLIYQNPATSYSSDNKFGGSSTSTVSGTLYFPNTSLTYTGSSSGQHTSIVADTVAFVGTTSILSDTTARYTALASRYATLFQ